MSMGLKFFSDFHRPFAILSSGYNLDDHFRDITKMVDIGSGAERKINDIQLTRYACYLVAQNGDARKLTACIAAYEAVKR